MDKTKIIQFSIKMKKKFGGTDILKKDSKL